MAEDREHVYSKRVHAGKRTYFFDVRSTRGRDLFLTITESKKHTHEDGSATYEKHKIYLYKEDFEKFLDGLDDAIEEIDRLRSSGEYVHTPLPRPDATTNGPGEDPPANGSFSDSGSDSRDLQDH